MTAARIDHAALLRGTAVGTLTAALSVAAHGVAGGGMAGGSVAAQLLVLAVTLGAVATTLSVANRAAVLWALLATGQLLGHALLSASGHVHAGAPGWVMFGSHLVAVSIGAGLISCGARLCAALSRVVRAIAGRRHAAPVPSTQVVVVSADQPRQSARCLASSVSHRGPPVGIAA